jgi:predicted unusual protein kinase regulating ubiquinone biosynthesis (AarF/ABC1/UbiB family)
MSIEENLETFAVHMEQQLDLLKEAKNLHKFQENFVEFPNICFPRPVNEMCRSE